MLLRALRLRIAARLSSISLRLLGRLRARMRPKMGLRYRHRHPGETVDAGQLEQNGGSGGDIQIVQQVTMALNESLM